MVSASEIVKKAQSYIGYNEKNGGHKLFIDTYNSYRPLPRGYAAKTTDEWCAIFVSAISIMCNATDQVLVECSCSKMTALYKAKGRWQENDGYKPQIGDIIMYDWQDSGSGDNQGNPDHVGIVASVSGNTIKVIEGNKGEAVAYRSLSVNGKYIRGYCLPNYASKATTSSKAPGSSTTSASTSVTVSLPILQNGSQGKPVEVLQRILTAKGYNTQGIDGSFGPKTAAALRNYQKAIGLPNDAVCAKNTWTNLLTK